MTRSTVARVHIEKNLLDFCEFEETKFFKNYGKKEYSAFFCEEVLTEKSNKSLKNLLREPDGKMPETERNDCKVCRLSNNLDNMVFCPRCEEWFHYHCVGVDETVANESWMCATCLALPPSVPAHTSTPVSTVASSLPVTTAAGSASQSLLTEQARADLQWIRDQRALLEREMEENHRIEMERKRLEMQKLANQAMMRILTDTLKDSSMASVNELSVAAGVNRVQNWIHGMVGEMKNLSVAQNSAVTEVTSSAMPAFDISSIATNAGAVANTFDPTLSSTFQGAVGGTVNPHPVTISPVQHTTPQSLASSQSGIDLLRATGAIPKGLVSQVPVMPALGSSTQTNVVTACPTLPTVSFPSLYPGVPSSLGLVSQPTTLIPQLQPYLGVATNVSQPVSAPLPFPGYAINSRAGGGLQPVMNPGIGTTGGGLQPLPFPGNVTTSMVGGGFPPVMNASSGATGGGLQPLPFPGNVTNNTAGGGFPPVMNPGSGAPGGGQQPHPFPGYGANTMAGGGLPPVMYPIPVLPRMYEPVGLSHVTPTQQQMMARQVMPRDLPPFRGDPEDWPLFYSAYVNSTTACGYTDVENLTRLQRALQGRALDAVKSRLLLPACVPQVLSTLYMLYGRPELIIQTLLNKIREVSPPRPDRLDTLISFGMAVQNFCDHLEAAGQVAHLCNPVLLQELVEKIPAQQRLDWSLYKRQFVAVDLRTFAAYMSTLAAAASDVTVISDCKQSRSSRSERGKEKNFLNTHSASEPPKKEIKEETPPAVLCLACNGANHKVKECGAFKKWSPESRWKIVQDHHLCRTCLGKHGRRPCKVQAHCGVNGCQLRHHQLLHSESQKQQSSAKDEQKPANQSKGSGEGVNAHHTAEKSTLFRILPVQLSWKGKSVETFAFLDDGSSMTLVEQSIVDRLEIDDGKPLPLCLTWTSNVTRQEPNSQRVCLEVSGSGKSEQFTLNDTRTVASLKLPKQTLKYEDLARQYTHLQGLPISSYEAVSPSILIGSNNASLIATLKLREGQLGDPLAAKTRLGWSIYGYAADQKKTANFTFHVCECEEETTDHALHDLVERHFTVESVGVSADKGPESEEDKRARRILEETTKRTSRGFETGLLWRHDQVEFPNSFPMAMRRLECFERRMRTDPELRDSVHRQIDEYLENGYIHELTSEEIKSADPDKVWYLPLGAVRNPKKPGKIRLVWDAAAKVGSVSLNTMLLKGPDMLVPLPAVLCGFRERPVAVNGDLKQMFHQYKIRQQDVNSQRFLFRKDPSQPVKVYAMDVGSFGATCSPCQAQFIKNLNAKEHESDYPQAAKAILKKHYVDDYLDSFDTEEEAIKVALEVKEVHARGGFEIRNWHSNSSALLERVGEPKRLQSEVINIDSENNAERILGLLWLPEEDLLAFATDVQLEDITPTKRNILRCVMSLFDSQGILSHVTIQGRMIIQDTWRSQTKWDEEVTESIRTRWRRWITLFNRVGQIRLPRAYFPGFSAVDVGSVELHVFTDASEEAYATTVFFRAVIHGKVYCTLVMAKAKVAPLKAVSVPRLELMGALLGARLAKAVGEYHTFPIRRRIFWTDSEATLAWIQSQHHRYRQFVAFRVGEILSKTEAAEWRWIPTLQNVADEATKWGRGPSTDVQSRWFKGPDFLYLPESEWPKRTSTKPLETDEELRPCLVHHERLVEDVIHWTNFSKWERLLRAIAYAHRFATNCRRKSMKQLPISGCLTKEELQKAENSLWLITQATSYPDEIAVLKLEQGNPKKHIEKTSPIYKLSPFLDDLGVMRVDSRIGAVPYVTHDFKFPIILPRNHPLTTLLVDWYHRKYLHANQETVHNEVRQRFHVSSLRTVVRRVAKDCQACKITKAVPTTPRMAPLPAARLAATVRPFSYVGLDYFGPINVRVGRSRVKRWVALFTCMTVRAVHLEVVHSLSTEACKMAVRRFIARRGSPVEILSDNGTNFLGASRELREEIETIGRQLQETFTNSATKWSFNPPSAPHFGGAWERLVRSVKVAMGSLCSDRNPDDETLLTVVTEAEAIVNSRPLTFIPLENSNQEALTPNHFILLSSTGVVQPPGALADPTKVTRTNWNMTRQLVDQFWRRWVMEYLPSIAKRTKWFEEVEAVKENDLVVIVNENQRNGWIRGRVLSVMKGSDGRIRQALVQTTGGVFRRPVSKLAVLKVQADGNGVPVAEPEVRYGSGDVANSGSTENKAFCEAPQSVSTSACDQQTSTMTTGTSA